MLGGRLYGSARCDGCFDPEADLVTYDLIQLALFAQQLILDVLVVVLLIVRVTGLVDSNDKQLSRCLPRSLSSCVVVVKLDSVLVI